MKKLLLVLSIFTLVLLAAASSAYAEGGKVRGDLGVGEVAQEGPCPFGKN